jgi:hypothetical protein
LALVHWVLSITALHCIPSKAKTENDERIRVLKLCDASKSVQTSIFQLYPKTLEDLMMKELIMGTSRADEQVLRSLGS